MRDGRYSPSEEQRGGCLPSSAIDSSRCTSSWLSAHWGGAGRPQPDSVHHCRGSWRPSQWPCPRTTEASCRSAAMWVVNRQDHDTSLVRAHRVGWSRWERLGSAYITNTVRTRTAQATKPMDPT